MKVLISCMFACSLIVELVSCCLHTRKAGERLLALSHSTEHPILLDVKLRHPIIPKSLSDPFSITFSLAPHSFRAKEKKSNSNRLQIFSWGTSALYSHVESSVLEEGLRNSGQAESQTQSKFVNVMLVTSMALGLELESPSPTSSPPTPPSPLPISYGPGHWRYSFSASSSPSPPFSPAHTSAESLPLLHKTLGVPSVFSLDRQDPPELESMTTCLKDLLEWFMRRCCSCFIQMRIDYPNTTEQVKDSKQW